MAREAGLLTWLKPPEDVIERLKRFEALVRADERAALVQEPVAHINNNGVVHAAGYPWGEKENLRPLVFGDTPPAAQPATEESSATQTVQEPVIQRVMSRLANLLDEDQFKEIEGMVVSAGCTPPAQPARVPLTDDQINTIRFSISTKAVTQRDFELARSIEAAHGITKG
jgi:hypothetical protein